MKDEGCNRIDKLWEEAFNNKGQMIPTGGVVVCDMCNEDYTFSKEEGGFIFGSNAVCPKCARRMLQNIIENGEQHYIKASCGIGQSFADFVREYNGPDSCIQVITF